MNEAQTRLNKIDPRLRDAGWSIIPGSKILVEQSAYIAPGRITTTLDSLKSKVDRLQANFEKISQECDALKQAILKKIFE